MRNCRQPLLFIALSLLCGFYVNGQVTAPSPYTSVSRLNYIRSWDAVRPDSVSSHYDMNAGLGDAILSTQYIDGLGRPVETVIKKGSLATGTTPVDLVNPIVYDEFGRERYKYLSFAANSTGGNTSLADGLFKSNPFQQDSAFDKSQFPGENFFYGQTGFENSVVSRPVEVFSPGDSWAGTASQTSEANRRSVKLKYWFNTLADSVRIWVVSDSVEKFGGYQSTSLYGAGTLSKAVTVDEHNKQVIEFKDKSGLVILKKVQYTSGSDPGTGSGHYGWLNTYYIYDRKNQLRCVVQPRGTELLLQYNWNMNALNGAIVNEQCFQYLYDAHGRMIMKRVPGAGTVWMVYDGRDRLVMAQDSSLRASHKWLYTVYENLLNRPVATGLLTDNSYYTGYPNNRSFHALQADTSSAYPVLSYYETEELTRTFYDDYSWRSLYGNPLSATINSSAAGTGSSDLYAASNSAYPYAQALTQCSDIRGLVTGTRTKVLGTSKYLYTVNFYDDKARVVQVQATNITDSSDMATTQYSWNGKPLITVQKHTKAAPNAQVIVSVSKPGYDSLWRVVKIEKKVSHSQVNNGAMPTGWKTIVQHYYNALGQLIKKQQGTDPNNSSSALDSLVYDYNIRGWMLGMNRAYVKDTASTSNYFGFDLGYDKTAFTVNGTAKSYAAAQYNGNITGMLWRSTGDDRLRKYDFTYDAVNRLTSADFNQFTGAAFTKTAGLDFSVSGLSYDANGNIITMNQRGWKIGGSQLIDSLNYNYIGNTNRLLNVIDAVNDTATILGDFRSSARYMNSLGYVKGITRADYDYDGNGNLTMDNNKDINFIHYNHLNLPDSIAVTGKGTIKYVYDATGNKIKKITTEGAKITTTLYLFGNYVNDTLQFIGQEEGRIRKKDSTQLVYDYFIKDHLGNVRMLLTEEQRTDMYPAATMETADASRDTTYYSNINSTRSSLPSGYPVDNSYSNPNNSVAKVNGSGNKIGPAIVLKVMAGDQFNLRVSDWYNKGGNTPGTPVNPITDLISALTGGIGSIATSHASTTELQTNATLNPGILSFYNSHNSTDSITKPKAFVNWVLFDEQFNYVAANSGFEQVGANNPATITVHTRNNLPIDKNGYLYIYVSNETPNIDVFFDNLQVTHIRGRELEETHYYPFGLTMPGINSKSLTFGYPSNKAKFNGIEQNNDLDLNMYDAHYRNLDPQIGRFWQIDPRPNEIVSSYTAMMNNPIRFSDPLGDTTWVYNQNGVFCGVVNDDLSNQVDFIKTDGDPGSTFDASKLNANDAKSLGNVFRSKAFAFIGSQTVSDMKKISKNADEKGFELGFVAQINESKEIRLSSLPDKFHQDDNKYDLLAAIDATYSKKQQANLFAAGHVHNAKHVTNVTGYDGYTGVMAKFLRLNTPSSTANGERVYPDYQPLLYRYDASTNTYNKGQTPSFIISAYGVTTYGTGTGYGGLNNVVQNPVKPNEYNSYNLYQQLKR